MSQTISVNFGKPMPLFPLPETVLLPHAVQPLHIFEPRYRQMINHVIDRSGQVAMATFTPGKFTNQSKEAPPLRPVVCVGQIVQHEKMPDGRYNILLHGVCRARIDTMHEPDGRRAYRMASLSPLEVVDHPPPNLGEVRDELSGLIGRDRLTAMRGAEMVREWFGREDVSTHALIELIGFTMVHDMEQRYQLLAESCPKRRAVILKEELTRMDRLLGHASVQSHRQWPKGMSWN